jgi:hypothetical protein
MHFRNFRIFAASVLALVSSVARAQSDDDSGGPASPSPGSEARAERWDQANLLALPWPERSGQGVGLGYQLGSWAGNFTQELRVRIPFGQAALHVGGIYLLDEPGNTHNLGGRLTLTSGTPVYLNLVRIYGGGGVDMLSAVNKEGSPLMWGGGGFFGFEFFMNHRESFFIEIGGRGGKKYSGATIMAGINLFPF